MHAQIANLLRTTIGLDTEVVGMRSIERAVSMRQTACGVDNPGAYWEYVRHSDQELQELIEEVIVPETWFFREVTALSAMAKFVQRLLTSRAHGMVRALSLPCATGEEPYSMAMALLDAGVPPHRFQIDAIDISEQALDKARGAVYGNNAFRGDDLRFRERYFVETEHGYRLDDAVTAKVTFRHGNIFDHRSMPASRKYDVIFCRNVLIYFDSQKQEQAIAAVLRLLHEDGCLFVGAAETRLLRMHGLAPIGTSKAFGFHRAKPAAKLPRSEPKKTRARLPALQEDRGIPIASNASPAQAPGPDVPPAAALHNDDRPDAVTLDEAAELANQGQLERAGALCEQYLQAHGPSAQVLHLLGLVQDARGQWQRAAEFYRRVLYLDPDHAEALAHLAALREKHGDAAGAARLRQRYARVLRRSEK